MISLSTSSTVSALMQELPKCEAIFKAFGVALGEALSLVPGRDDVPSTKGTL